MAGMYPENEEVTIFGEKVQWPGVDKNGKFTNGSFSDPHEPPSFIPAGTINLILDNLSALITKLGGKPDNSSVTQLAELFTSAPQVNTGIMRDTAGRAKVAAPVEADDIARKAEVDAEVQARTQSISNLAQSFQQAINNEAQARTQGDGAISSQLSAHAGNNSNPHGVSKAQLGLGNVDNTHDNQKSVKYAATAGSAKANGGNADTVDGYHAGNGVNMLVPVVAFNVGENVGYIKLGNGLIVQWGYNNGQKKAVPFPISFSNTSYIITARIVWDSNQAHSAGHQFFHKFSDKILRQGNSGLPFEYIAIGI